MKFEDVKRSSGKPHGGTDLMVANCDPMYNFQDFFQI